MCAYSVYNALLARDVDNDNFRKGKYPKTKRAYTSSTTHPINLNFTCPKTWPTGILLKQYMPLDAVRKGQNWIVADLPLDSIGKA